MRAPVRFLRRGRQVNLTGAEARMTLLDWLRLEDRSVGTKEGCAEGDCGACTVILARLKGGRVVHEPVNSCILLAGQAEGAEVLTVEDLSIPGGTLHPVQEAMVRHHGSQCGFCTPGIVMSLAAMFADAPRPVTRAAVCDQLAGNLCRCTGYRPIIEAAMDACATAAPAPSADRHARLAALASDDDLFSGDDDAFFAAPRSAAAASALLATYPDALLVAGATDAGLWITKQLLEPRRVVWLGRVAGLDRIERSANELSIGATVTVAGAYGSLAALAPDLGEVLRRFGSAQVRASATVGGNIANGSPIGDLAPCLIALGAMIELQRGATRRRLPLESLFLAYKQQDRQPGELVRCLIVPGPAEGLVFRAYKISKRMDEDISSVLGAFAFRIAGRRLTSARVAFGGMSGVPSRAEAVEAALTGLDLDRPDDWTLPLDCLDTAFTPMSDHRASATYRRIIARNLLKKALLEAAGSDLTATRISPQMEASDAGL
jgi:xanthine dehydrogenase small subunit